MSVLDRSRVDIRLGEYGTTSSNALSDPMLLARVQEYRRLVGGRTVSLAQEDLRRKLSPSAYSVSRKLDGEFTVLVVREDEVFTLNPGGTVRVGLPFAQAAREACHAAGVRNAMIAGELHVVRAGERTRIHDVVRVAQKPTSAKELATLHFAPFDMIEPQPRTVAENFARLEEIFGGVPGVAPVEHRLAKSVDEVARIFEEWVVNDGAEGLIIRSDEHGTFKAKLRYTLDLVVVGFSEGTEDRRGMVHDLLLAAARPDGSMHIIGRVGGGISEDDRRSMFADLRDLMCGSEYSEVSSDHVAYQMVRPEWVIEISCLDFISTTSRGSAIERMVLRFDIAKDEHGRTAEGEGTWRVLRRMPLVSIIGPVFVRRRTDKEPNSDQAGIQQVAKVVVVPDAHLEARALELPKSEILRRDVYTKMMKGHAMVRKLILWKTNKEDSTDYPPYVLYQTDFSPNRKTPLERDLRVSSSRDQIEKLYDELAKTSFVKGWAKAES